MGERIGVGMFVVPLLGAGAARLVPPETLWPLQVLSIALVPLACALIVFATVAGGRRRWGLAAFCFAPVALILALPMAASERVVSPAAEPGAETVPLKVVTFNAKPEAITKGEAGFRALLREENPHLVALQEFPLRVFATGEVGGSRLLVPFLEDRAYSVTRPEPAETANIARPIFSRIESTGPADFLPSPFGVNRSELWASGGFTRALYRWDGVTIAVYNLHLHSFSGTRPWEEGWRRILSPGAWADALRAYRVDFRTRAEQARAIRQLIDAETHPFLIFGDFNSTPSTWVYAYLSRGLQDAFGRAGTGWGGTFPARCPLIRIDFVLASGEWEVRRAYVSKTVVSDHAPMVAELVLHSAR